MTAPASKLDPEIRDYLAAVARSKGADAPGIYIPGSANPWPAFGCLLGGIMILATLSSMLMLPKSASAVAMAVTAGLWLGGWLVLYPFRRWIGNRLGTFQFFDPYTVYQVDADDVTATDISDMKGLHVDHKYAGDSYTGSLITFDLPGRSFTAKTKFMPLAEKVENYYALLGRIESDPAWANRTPAEHGAMAAYHAALGEWPADFKLTNVSIEVPTELPESRAGGMFARYLLVLGLGVACYLLSWQLLKPLQDDEAFRAAATMGVQGYRDYLLDDRNTKHVDEARAKIREFYAPKIAQLDSQVKDAAHRDGLKAILKALSESPSLPVVSIRVVEEPGAVGNFAVMQEPRKKAVRQELADALGTHFNPAYITFVEAPAGEPAHFELNFKQLNAQQLQWTLSLRETPEAEGVTGPTQTAAVIDPLNPAFALKQSIFQTLFGVAPPTVNQVPIGGGEFDE